MLGMLLERESGVELTHVPYKGTAAYINELIGGQVPSAFDAPGDLSEQHPDVVPKLATLNMEASGGTLEEFRKVVQDDWAKWGAVVKACGFTLD